MAYLVAGGILVLAALPLFFQFVSPFFVFLFAVVLVLIAVVARPWHRKVGSTQFALYWIVLALLIAFIAALFIAEDIMVAHRTKFYASPPGTPRPESGQPENDSKALAFGICAAFVTGSALLFAFIRRRVLGGTEIAIYWAGSAIAISVALFWLFYAKDWRFIDTGPRGTEGNSVLAAAGFTVISGVLLALLRGRAVSEAELLIYWLGSAVAAGLGAAVLGSADSPLIVCLFVLAAVIVTLPLWWIAHARRSRLPSSARG